MSRAALIQGDRVWSYGDLNAEVETLANSMADIPGPVFSLANDHALSTALFALAAPRAGLVFHPHDPAVPPVLRWDRQAPAAPLLPEAVQLIIATSGSSGGAKGVMLTGQALTAAARAANDRLALGPDDVWLGCLPMHHIGGLSLLFRCLAAGAATRLHQGFDAAAVGRDLAQGLVSHVSLVPAMLARLLDLEVRPAPRLRCVLVGGAALSASLAERARAAGWPVIPSFGMSESSALAACCSDFDGWSAGLVGPPLPSVELGFDADGQIRLRGPAIMAGYANPQLRPGDGLDRDGWIETGDLGRLDPQGRLWIDGRADDRINSGGKKIHPLQIEQLACRYPGLRDLAITTRPDPVWGDIIVAVLVGNCSTDDFLRWCRDSLPSWMRPRAALRLEALPLNGTGKLDRRALRQWVKEE